MTYLSTSRTAFTLCALTPMGSGGYDNRNACQDVPPASQPPVYSGFSDPLPPS